LSTYEKVGYKLYPLKPASATLSSICLYILVNFSSIMNLMITYAIVAIIATIGVATLTLPFATIPVEAGSDHCHDTRGSFGCNPGSFPFGGFVCNREQCHDLPNS
jgi:hypothetical protein